MAGLIVKSLTLNDIRVMCSNIRMLLGISADEYVDIVKVLEHQITS